MTTRVYLGGGGTPQQEAAVWRLFLRPSRRVVCWPQALPPSQHEMAGLWLRRQLAAYDVPRVETWSDLGGRATDDLDPESDVVFVLGGNTFDLLHHLQSRDALDLAPAHVARGGVFFGSSAGAVLAGADIEIAAFADPNDAGVSDTTGLRLLGGAIVRPHYTADDRDDSWQWTGRGLTVLGIPEDAGLAVIDGVATNAGPAPVEVLTGSTFAVLDPGDHLEL
ncbi:MAG TPA: Type 1 glutamine amidotransferase-like domain-containing protein [Candidatus Nanopelagicales bacterium]|nr:Type 1 glutamine amidotransferase-like domain-containing protein [Candidatus Nanopelagicales bacterium]